MSEDRPNACMIFLPTELYVGLIKKMAKYEIGKSAAILDSINEDLYSQGFIDDETYHKFKEAYMKRLVDIVHERVASSINMEVKTTKVEVQKRTIEVSKPKKRPDYSKMSLEELEKRLNHLRDIGDTSEVQFVAFEIKKRLAEKGVKT